MTTSNLCCDRKEINCHRFSFVFIDLLSTELFRNPFYAEVIVRHLVEMEANLVDAENNDRPDELKIDRGEDPSGLIESELQLSEERNRGKDST